MPSSTSSSNAVVPQGSWGRAWLLGAVLLVLAVTGFELTARHFGHQPSVSDDAQLWAYWRRKANGPGKSSLVLLGGSRIELGVSTPQLRQSFPDLFITMLAVNGTQPVASLRDLADDPAFSGIVIIDVTAQSIERRFWQSQQYVVDQYRAGYPLDRDLNIAISLVAQQHLIITSPFLNLGKVAVVAAKTRAFRAPYHVTTHADRSQSADFTKIADLAAFHRSHVKRIENTDYSPSQPDDWLAAAKEVAQMARAIEKRGGKVVFLRMPMGPALSAALDEHYPRARYWDRFAELEGVLAIRADDHPQLSSYDVPDEAHLDYRDAEKFTLALVCLLVAREVLPHPAASVTCNPPVRAEAD